MPYVNIKFSTPIPPKEKLDKLAKDITNLLVDDLGKARERVVVTFEPVEGDYFYFGGKSVNEIKAKK